MRVLFVHNALRSFVRVDRDILASTHKVDELDLSVPARVATLPARLAHADLVFAWFASLHSLFPVLGARYLRKPTLVVVGGYDTASLPDIGYGYMAHPWKRHVVRIICRSSSALLANSNFAREEVQRNVQVRTPIHVVYHGFEQPDQPIQTERSKTVLSVGNVSTESLRRKGHEVFARTAALVPEAHFVLVGRFQDEAHQYLRTIAPSNFSLPGYVSQSELNELMHHTSVYVQASAHEGFGCAVAEAMLAGCVPVVSTSGALPEVVGERGIFVDPQDPTCVAAGIRRALTTPPELRQLMSTRTAEFFSLHRRRDLLLQLVDDLKRGNTDQDTECQSVPKSISK